MAWFFTADWHLNHSNIIKYCNRPFLSEEESKLIELSLKNGLSVKDVKISPDSIISMNDSIINSTNEVVNEDDNLVILGDFCWTSTPKEKVSELVSKIRCKNLYLIWGNHDNRNVLPRFFKSTYDHYTFCIESQHIFVSHYPCRSWNLSSRGSWMLYGHVHNRFWNEDNGLLTQDENLKLRDCLEEILPSYDGLDKAVSLIAAVFRKPIFSLDVGVDNIRDGVPFGTPWSYSEIKSHMESKLFSKCPML